MEGILQTPEAPPVGLGGTRQPQHLPDRDPQPSGHGEPPFQLPGAVMDRYNSHIAV